MLEVALSFCKIKHMKKYLEAIVIRIFVDNIYLHKFVSCHRISNRSFFINNRQFHICARCTGLLTGFILSISLLPFKSFLSFLFPIFLFILIVDGLTQYFNIRESNNTLRFFTGITTSSTFISFLFFIIN